MWSKEEIDILMSNIERYLKVCVGVCYLLVGVVMQLLLETNFLQYFPEQAISDFDRFVVEMVITHLKYMRKLHPYTGFKTTERNIAFNLHTEYNPF